MRINISNSGNKVHKQVPFEFHRWDGTIYFARNKNVSNANVKQAIELTKQMTLKLERLGVDCVLLDSTYKF